MYIHKCLFLNILSRRSLISRFFCVVWFCTSYFKFLLLVISKLSYVNTCSIIFKHLSYPFQSIAKSLKVIFIFRYYHDVVCKAQNFKFFGYHSLSCSYAINSLFRRIMRWIMIVIMSEITSRCLNRWTMSTRCAISNIVFLCDLSYDEYRIFSKALGCFC